jgi:hypothetical protein
LQRSDPIDPKNLTAQNITDYDDFDAAVGAFIQAEWGHAIDGIPVVLG